MKRTVSFFLLIIAGSLLWAGGGTQVSSGGKSRVYTIMFPLTFPEVPPPDTPIVLELKKLTSTPFEFQYVPTDGYQDRLNIAIAAGELPDIFVVTDTKHNTFISAVNGGLIWEVTDAIKSSKNISKNMPQQVLINTNMGGKNYFVPRTRAMVDTGFTFRKDWLEKLGLKSPTNLDEVYNIIKAFTIQDPDGNGKNDTVGLITAADSSGIWQLRIPATMIFGAGNGWVEENGGLIPIFMTKPYMDTIRFYKRLYDEKLMNQDFATIRAERALEILNTEAGGAFFDTIDRVTTRFEVLVKTKKTQNPNIEIEDLWDFTTEIKSADGSIRLPAISGYNGGFALPKTSVKTQAEFQTAFGILDTFDSDEAKDIIRYGIEGRNFEFQNGKAVAINVANHPREVALFGQLYVTGSNIPGKIDGARRPYRERVDTINRANIKYGISDPTFPLISATQISRGAELQKIVADAQIQWVMGQINEAGYMAAIEQWKKSGGQAIIDEFTQAWKANR